MKTIRIGKVLDRSLKNSLRTWLYHLLVDVIPTVLLLIAMAFAMALVSSAATVPGNAALSTVAKTLF